LGGHPPADQALSDVPWPPYAEAASALLRVDEALASSPDDIGALFKRARLLDTLGRSGAARQAYLDVLARDLCHDAALIGLGAILFAQGFTSAARTTYDRAVAVNPGNLAARVQRGNLLRLAEYPDLARRDYEAALLIEPDCREAHQGLSYIIEASDPARATYHRQRGFAGSGVVSARYHGAQIPITVLRFVSAHGGNIPLSEVLDRSIFLVHTVVAEFAGPDLAFPAHDVVFNAIGDPDRCDDALGALPHLLRRTTAPVLNAPERVSLTSRASPQLHAAGLPGVIVPTCIDITRAALTGGPPPGFDFPFLLRSPGFHTGEHFHLVRDVSGLRDAVSQLPGSRFFAIQYFDTEAADYRFRKYRVMMIGDALYPLHLAISSTWKVHYFTADMARDEAWRREEAAFLNDMQVYLGARAMDALHAVRRTLGLDYAGIDFGLAPDGRIIVFEANAAMTIVSPSSDPIWDYRRPAIRRAIDAAQRMIGKDVLF
jgi:tetratricopeptide (TPR) repeat protein